MATPAQRTNMYTFWRKINDGQKTIAASSYSEGNWPRDERSLSSQSAPRKVIPHGARLNRTLILSPRLLVWTFSTTSTVAVAVLKNEQTQKSYKETEKMPENPSRFRITLCSSVDTGRKKQVNCFLHELKRGNQQTKNFPSHSQKRSRGKFEFISLKGCFRSFLCGSWRMN